MQRQYVSGQLNWYLSAGRRVDSAVFQGRARAVSHPQLALSTGIAQTHRPLSSPSPSVVATGSDARFDGWDNEPSVSDLARVSFHRANWIPGLHCENPSLNISNKTQCAQTSFPGPHLFCEPWMFVRQSRHWRIWNKVSVLDCAALSE